MESTMVLLAGLVVSSCVAIQLASRLAVQQSGNTSKPETDSEHVKAKQQQLELDLSYAKAYLRLMEAIQDKFQEANRRQPNTVSPSVIQVTQEGVGEARDRVQLLEKGDLSDAGVCVAIAETELRSAQESLGKAEQANGVLAGLWPRCRSRFSRPMSNWPKAGSKKPATCPPNPRFPGPVSNSDSFARKFTGCDCKWLCCARTTERGRNSDGQQPPSSA